MFRVYVCDLHVCMYVCMRKYIYIYVYMYIYIYIYIYIVCICVFMCAYVHVCMYDHVCTTMYATYVIDADVEQNATRTSYPRVCA
jgi:hypothetical protein